MQTVKSIQRIFRKSELRYKERHLAFDKIALYQWITCLYERAKENYLKLPNPKTCNLDTYTNIWINEEIGNDISKQGVGKSFKLGNPPDNYEASADFLNSYPSELLQEMRHRQAKVWNQIDFNNIKEKWLAMVVERNNFSLNNGFVSRLDMYLNNFNIPKSEYNKFLRNVGAVINFCNKHLTLDKLTFSEQESGKFCFICDINKFPLKDNEELLKVFSKKYPLIKRHMDKINIQLADTSQTKYIKETDTFEITLNNNTNTKHQIVDLIHELAHAESQLGSLEKDGGVFRNGVYYREKSAIDIEINFIKKYLPELFPPTLGEILQIVHQTLFEIEIYNNPKEDPDKLYAVCFNKCFEGPSQKNNKSYLLNSDILYNNFRQLPYAIGYINVLKNINAQIK